MARGERHCTLQHFILMRRPFSYAYTSRISASRAILPPELHDKRDCFSAFSSSLTPRSLGEPPARKLQPPCSREYNVLEWNRVPCFVYVSQTSTDGYMDADRIECFREIQRTHACQARNSRCILLDASFPLASHNCSLSTTLRCARDMSSNHVQLF